MYRLSYLARALITGEGAAVASASAEFAQAAEFRLKTTH